MQWKGPPVPASTSGDVPLEELTISHEPIHRHGASLNVNYTMFKAEGKPVRVGPAYDGVYFIESATHHYDHSIDNTGRYKARFMYDTVGQ